jgi:hypothetical protein
LESLFHLSLEAPMKFHAITTLIVTVAACAPKPDSAPGTPPQEVTFSATDFAFAGPDSIMSGFTTIRLVNQGRQDHQLILGKLEDGKTLQDLIEFTKAHPGAEPPFLLWRGAAGAVAASGTSSGTVDLAAGNYVALCFLPDPTDGKDHLSKGMFKELLVTSTRQGALAPQAEGEIRLKDFSFEAPTITAGTHTFHVFNDGPQTHEVQLIRLNDGVTGEDFLAAKGPPPGVMLGGPGAYSKGGDGYWTMTFEPGNYLFVCFVPDPASGMPHMLKGMVHEFTVPTT